VVSYASGRDLLRIEGGKAQLMSGSAPGEQTGSWSLARGQDGEIPGALGQSLGLLREGALHPQPLRNGIPPQAEWAFLPKSRAQRGGAPSRWHHPPKHNCELGFKKLLV